MHLGLDQKKVFISASSDGIGRAIAESFLKEKAYVCVNGRNSEKLKKTVLDLGNKYGNDRVMYVCGDIINYEVICATKMVIEKEWGGLDVIVCNVGSGRPSNANRYSPEEWIRLLDINLLSSVKLINEMVGMINKSSSSSVVMLSSLAGIEKIGAPPAYAASKAGIRSLVKYLSDDLAEYGTRVNAVAPGNVYYEGGRWQELRNNDVEAVDTYINSSVPMKRFGRPEEIADAVVFLASDRASFITGEILRVDGGQSRSY